MKMPQPREDKKGGIKRRGTHGEREKRQKREKRDKHDKREKKDNNNKKEKRRISDREDSSRAKKIAKRGILRVFHAGSIGKPNIGKPKRTFEAERAQDEPPIVRFSEVPEGWSFDDGDIDENDIDAMIERCDERIRLGIMPQWWTRKRQIYWEAKERSEIIQKEARGVSSDISIRLKYLEEVAHDLLANGDIFEQSKNVDAIMRAYALGDLTWNDGLVTYWSQGTQLSLTPTPFNWADFDKYSEEAASLGGRRSFWVEGLNGPGPAPNYPALAETKNLGATIQASGAHVHSIEFCLRIPPRNGEVADSPNDKRDKDSKTGREIEGDRELPLGFIDDTASSVMVIYEDDLTQLEDIFGRPARPMGSFIAAGLSELVVMETVKLEVTMRNEENIQMIDWVPVQVAIRPGNPLYLPPRLSGPWMREKFYVGSSPNSARELIVSTNKKLLTRELDAENAEQMPDLPPATLKYVPSIFNIPQTDPNRVQYYQKELPGAPSRIKRSEQTYLDYSNLDDSDLEYLGALPHYIDSSDDEYESGDEDESINGDVSAGAYESGNEEGPPLSEEGCFLPDPEESNTKKSQCLRASSASRNGVEHSSDVDEESLPDRLHPGFKSTHMDSSDEDDQGIED